jgi:hypothetical protein
MARDETIPRIKYRLGHEIPGDRVITRLKAGINQGIA